MRFVAVGEGAVPARPVGAVQARLAVLTLFVLMGVMVGSWASRVPDVRSAVGLDDQGWGLANGATTVGDAVALATVSIVIGRVRTRMLAVVGAAVVLVNTPVLAAARTLPALVIGLVLWGLAANLLAVPMNAMAVGVEERYGRPILSTFHAGFSVGMLAGGALGTLAAAARVAPSTQLTGSSAVLAVVLLVARRRLPEDARKAAGGELGERLRRRLTPQLAVLATIAFLTALVEGAATQWSAVYTSQTLGAGAVAGAAAYTVLTVAATVARLGGDRVVGLLGRAVYLRWSTGIAALGLAVALVGGGTVGACLGFALMGLGIACVMPTVIALAGEQPGLTSGEGVSMVVLGQWPGFLAAPVLIGLLAGQLGLRSALVAVLVALIGILVLVGRITVAADRAAG